MKIEVENNIVYDYDTGEKLFELKCVENTIIKNVIISLWEERNELENRIIDLEEKVITLEEDLEMFEDNFGIEE